MRQGDEGAGTQMKRRIEARARRADKISRAPPDKGGSGSGAVRAAIRAAKNTKKTDLQRAHLGVDVGEDVIVILFLLVECCSQLVRVHARLWLRANQTGTSRQYSAPAPRLTPSYPTGAWRRRLID